MAQENRSDFSKRSANVCLGAPLITIVMALVFNALIKQSNNLIPANARTAATLAFAAIVCLLIVTGLVMGVVGLATMKTGARTSVILRCVAGFAITLLLIGIAVPNFQRARTAALANKQAIKEVKVASDELRNDASESLANSQKAAANLSRFQKKLGDAAANASGDEALLLKGSQAFTAQIAILQKSYQQSAQELRAATVLSTSNLVARGTLQERRQVVQRFLKSNDELKVWLSQSEDKFRQELINQKVPADKIDSAMKGFEKTSRPQAKYIREIREADDRMGQAMMDTLDLLHREWGQWHYNPATSRLIFENTEALEVYKTLQGQIRSAQSAQVTSQNGLALVMKHPVTQVN